MRISAKYKLGFSSEFAPSPRKTTENLEEIDLSQDLPNS
jgi:hypothetical protein